MDKLKKIEEWEIPEEFIKTKQVEKLVKQWIINVLNYHTYPNCWDDYLEDEWCLDCGYWVLNNKKYIKKLPNIEQKWNAVFYRTSTKKILWKDSNKNTRKILEIEHNWENIKLNDYKKNEKWVEFIKFERCWVKYRIYIYELNINENIINSFKIKIETKKWNKYKHDFLEGYDFRRIKSISRKILEKLLIK